MDDRRVWAGKAWKAWKAGLLEVKVWEKEGRNGRL
jgi:hypothetical protein